MAILLPLLLRCFGCSLVRIDGEGSHRAAGCWRESGNGSLRIYHHHAGGFGIERIWTPRLNQIVTWIIAPILVLVGIHFILWGWA